MYTIGTHSDDARFVHVSLDGDDLFDVQLYGDGWSGDADECRWYVESLAALEDLVNAANNVGVDTESSASRQHFIDTGRYLRADEA